MEERTLAEVGLVGNEGIVGLSVFLGIEATPFKAIVQVPGEAMRMKADVFKDLVNPDSPLYSLLLRKSWGTRGIVLRKKNIFAKMGCSPRTEGIPSPR